MSDVATDAAGGESELKKLRDEVKRLREAIEARPFVMPLPICVPVPLALPWYVPQPTATITWTIQTNPYRLA